ncbi:hypothetical protein FA95DRAFT_1574844 [Auriscalpium vulgare]|uniref:Uncharacterized protein n=1 Tax=Auriscalpium vulgare TaxID=40419 RepID=A0ACB8RIU5_9AGAM|nr:hypothetical protein FA95DRAFT_1574844 [Auriscalpium vulgare]
MDRDGYLNPERVHTRSTLLQSHISAALGYDFAITHLQSAASVFGGIVTDVLLYKISQRADAVHIGEPYPGGRRFRLIAVEYKEHVSLGRVVPLRQPSAHPAFRPEFPEWFVWWPESLRQSIIDRVHGAYILGVPLGEALRRMRAVERGSHKVRTCGSRLEFCVAVEKYPKVTHTVDVTNRHKFGVQELLECSAAAVEKFRVQASFRGDIIILGAVNVALDQWYPIFSVV